MFLLLTQDQEEPHFKNMYDLCQQEIRSPSTQAVSTTGILSSFQTSPHQLPVPPSFQSASCLNKNNNSHSTCVSMRRNDKDNLNGNSLNSVAAPLDPLLDPSGREEVTIEERSFENANTLRRRILLMNRTSGPTGSTDKSQSESESNSQTVQCPVLQESRGGEGRKGIMSEEDADAGNISSFSSTSASPSICLDNNRRHSLSKHQKEIEPASHSSSSHPLSSHPLQAQMPSSCQTQRMSVGGGEKRLTGVSSSFTRDDDGGEEQFWV